MLLLCDIAHPVLANQQPGAQSGLTLYFATISGLGVVSTFTTFNLLPYSCKQPSGIEDKTTMKPE